MNVGELIEKLKTYPQDLRVVVHGYEDGYEDVTDFEIIKVILNVNTTRWYYGDHAYADSYIGPNADELKKSAVNALHIG